MPRQFQNSLGPRVPHATQRPTISTWRKRSRMQAAMKKVGLFTTAAASAALALLLTGGDDGWGVFLLWASSLVLAAWSLRGPAPAAAPILPRRADALALFGIVAVSGCARLYRIEQLPFGLWIDELWTAHNAARLGAQPGFHPFGATPLLGYMPAWVQTSNLYLYACWIIEWAFGFSRFGAKMISVVPALLAGPLLYTLARQCFGLWPSLLASFLFAVSSWHVTLRRARGRSLHVGRAPRLSHRHGSACVLSVRCAGTSHGHRNPAQTLTGLVVPDARGIRNRFTRDRRMECARLLRHARPESGLLGVDLGRCSRLADLRALPRRA